MCQAWRWRVGLAPLSAKGGTSTSGAASSDVGLVNNDATCHDENGPPNNASPCRDRSPTKSRGGTKRKCYIYITFSIIAWTCVNQGGITSMHEARMILRPRAVERAISIICHIMSENTTSQRTSLLHHPHTTHFASRSPSGTRTPMLHLLALSIKTGK